MGALILFGGIALLIFASVAVSWRRSAKAFEAHLREHGSITAQQRELEKSRASYQAEIGRSNAEFARRQSALSELAKQKAIGFPYLGDAWIEYLQLRDKSVENHLKYKSHPAVKAADTVKLFASERRQAIKAAKIAEYKLRLYETLFPWLTQFTEEGVEDAFIRVGSDGSESAHDPALGWLTEGEYKSLSASERNQRALDRYRNRRKTTWEIGRDYERYIGHIFESKGLEVLYVGAIEGFDDLGRDLVVRGDKRIKIVQCKYWAERKQIHEKHLFQLFGTSVEFALRLRLGQELDRLDLHLPPAVRSAIR